MKPLRLERDKKRIRLKDLGSTPVEQGKNRTRTSQDGMALDEMNNAKPPEELNEKNGEENDNLCHELN